MIIMRYFKVDSVQMAMDLSSLIYTIMYPAGVTVETQYLFGWITSPNGTVIRIPENYHCPVFIKDNFQTVVDELAAILNGAVADGEGAQLVAYSQTGSVILENLIPSGLEEVNEQYLIDNGIIQNTL